VKRQYRHFRRGALLALGGSLFADVLLVLGVLLFATNALAAKSAPLPASTPSVPHPSVEPAVPASRTRLDPSPYVLSLTVDSKGLLNGDPQATQHVQNQFERNLADLMNRSAGLAIAYGGALTQGQIDMTEQGAMKVEAILRDSGNQGQSVFTGAVFHAPLYSLGHSTDTVSVKIYLYT